MQVLSRQDFQSLIAGAEILKRHHVHGECVYKTQDNKILKLYFRRQRRMLPCLSYTQTNKLIHNSKKLQRYNIPVINIERSYQYVDKSFDVAVYPYIEGVILRDLIRTDDVNVLTELAKFITKLHQHNIYFCDGHLGNYILQEDGRLGLIDMHNLRFHLTLRRRAKNLIYMFFHAADIEYTAQYGWQTFLRQYLLHASLSWWQRKQLRYYLQYYLKHKLSRVAENEKNIVLDAISALDIMK